MRPSGSPFRLNPAWMLALALCGPAVVRAQDPVVAPDTPEPGSIEAIREHTTAPEYLPATVSYVPESGSVPSPGDVLGHIAGAPGELTRVAAIHGYFERLASASPRVQLRRQGVSVEGRDILLAVVSSEENLDRLEELKGITARLADPRGLDPAEARRLAAGGRVVYHLIGGLHSPETGPPEMLMELAYRLAVSEQPEVREIRDNVIVLITPVMDPDGRDRVVEWYERHLKGRTMTWEEYREFPRVPYWGHYVYHDNNRDGIQVTLPLTRAVLEAYREFHPQVIHDLHESVPLLYISTGHGPYSRAVDPVTVNEWTQFAHHEAGALQALGLPGVWVWGFWDGWWPGYLFSIANNHNSTGRFYETFGNSVPWTLRRRLDDRRFAGEAVTADTWYRPWPPEKTVSWSLRNNTNYMQAGVLEALGYAARHREDLLDNFRIKGERAAGKGRGTPPHAWIFGEEQRDPGRLAYLVNRLLDQDIEVHRLDREYRSGERVFAAGGYVVRMDQPYRNAAVNFLDVQKFPADEPNPPYDDVAWTFPLVYGVEGARIDSADVLAAPVTPVTGPVTPRGEVRGSGGVFLLADTGQNALLAARVRLGGHTVEAAEREFKAGRRTYPAGSGIVDAPAALVESIAGELGLVFDAVREAPEVPRHVLDLPRLAVFHTWTATQDCGWTRYTLDREGMPYTLINPDDLREGGLRERFDVILFPPTWGDFARIVHGYDTKFAPVAYTRTDEFPSHGTPDASEDITGGMGFEGLLNLQRFVAEGGVFAAAAGSATLPVEGGLVRNVESVNTRSVNTPGSVLRARVVRREHPLAYGFEEMTTAFRRNGPLFDVPDRYADRVVLQFGTKEREESGDGEAYGEGGGAQGPEAETGGKGGEPLVLSGYVKGEKTVDGKPAILDVPVGEGRVILFAFNPLHRYINHAEFRWMFNLILNWNDLPGEEAGR